MPLPLELLRMLTAAEPSDAWRALFDHAWTICAAPLTAKNAVSHVTARDTELRAADLFLATAGYDLWRDFEAVVPRTAIALQEWWTGSPPGRAVLILDALSLREVPWILAGAAEHGYTIHQQRATGAELPPDTDPFAAALGLSGRNALQSNRGAGRSVFAGASTEAVGLPWMDCANLITPSPDWIFWHTWLDDRVHELKIPGQGLGTLTQEASREFSSPGFWALIDALSTGRRLIITGDHGYAASGQFPDTQDTAQVDYLKGRFQSGRSNPLSGRDALAPGPWVPPLDLQLPTAHGDFAFALGQRKWKSPGGYPTLTHGGLSLLEVAVPFIELSRTQGN